MSQVITAVYENGVLRPVSPLPLQEHQRVTVQIVSEPPQKTIARVLQLLTNAGRITPPRNQPAEAHVSETERLQVARALGEAVDKPLSDFILEERDVR